MEKNYIEQVAKMLGVNMLEEFKIQPTKSGSVLGCKEDKNTYRFDLCGLVYKGYNDGWSEWYGGTSRILEKLLLGLYKVVKISK